MAQNTGYKQGRRDGGRGASTKYRGEWSEDCIPNETAGRRQDRGVCVGTPMCPLSGKDRAAFTHQLPGPARELSSPGEQRARCLLADCLTLCIPRGWGDERERMEADVPPGQAGGAGWLPLPFCPWVMVEVTVGGGGGGRGLENVFLGPTLALGHPG